LYSTGAIYNSITSFKKANDFMTEYLRATKNISKLIYSYIKFGDKGGFDNKAVKKTDIQFLFVRYVEDAFGGEIIEPA
jgi:hypothetical protein